MAQITTGIVHVVEVPRSLLGQFLKMPESQKVAVYFLIGQGNDTEDPKVYVGQTADMRVRFPRHNAEKDFWERALVLLTSSDSFTQTHALFLERYCLQEVKKAGRYVPTNGNNASRQDIPPPLEADCYELFDIGRMLLTTLGYPLFEPLVPLQQGDEQPEMLFCRASGADGRGYYTQDGLVVLQGSTGRRENVPSMEGTSAGRRRERLIESGVLRVEGDRVVLTKDHIFDAPSAAAVALTGRSADGWSEWKNAAGKTLRELKGAPATTVE
ncbi:GIY-YIG nuclease family protein [Caldimonas brevitalea]|uniref:GIY-YIG nuclease family protein n=1 Tax=Caldimonas brevitalea TaxID=413882 RepID=UPI001EEE55D1|nr:GIY-YIG nuclease family protein [Caldimonas brevitalea]